MAKKIRYVNQAPRREGNEVFVSLLWDAAWDDKVVTEHNEWDAAAQMRLFKKSAELAPDNPIALENARQARLAYCSLLAYKMLHSLPMAYTEWHDGRSEIVWKLKYPTADFSEEELSAAKNEVQRAIRASGEPMSSCYCSPFFLPNPISSLIWKYGIAGGYVFTRKRFGLGPGPSLPVENIVDSYAEGGPLWGDVVFMNQVNPVVRWKNVFRPDHKLQLARRTLGAASSRQKVEGHDRRERPCPFCAESILIQAKLCKHCRQTVDSNE